MIREVILPETNQLVPMNAMKIGSAGLMRTPGKACGHVVLRVHFGLVSLFDESLTWNLGAPVEIEPLPAGTKLVLETK